MLYDLLSATLFDRLVLSLVDLLSDTEFANVFEVTSDVELLRFTLLDVDRDVESLSDLLSELDAELDVENDVEKLFAEIAAAPIWEETVAPTLAASMTIPRCERYKLESALNCSMLTFAALMASWDADDHWRASTSL